MNQEGGISQGWATIDADGTAPTLAARLDVSNEWPSVKRLRTTNFALLDLKPGEGVLEVGSGTGAFAQQMAALVGNSGSVVGVDLNASIAAISTERAGGSGLPVTFQQGDVHHLEFQDGTFDACFAQGVFIHLDDPVAALQEMVRVTRPGGRVVVCKPDMETIIFDAPDFEASRVVRDARNRRYRDPRMGRKLPRMFKEAGLTGVVVETTMGGMPPSRAALWARTDWAAAVEQAVQEDKLTQERADAWVESLDRASLGGYFFFSSTLFCVGGRKP